MSQGVTAASRDLKKLLDNPKIIFVLGGPASGKGTQCDKIVQEFGFSHISTGDLMRAETSKGTKLGEQIKKIQAKGNLVPFEITVQVLINGLIATPSKSKTYLIDGFPRALDQANYFEKNVIEAHQILFYDVPKEKMLERCMHRAKSSGRADDNEVTIQKRVDTYFSQTLPVVDYYKQFGKVQQIDATGTIDEVYAQTKKAILPQCMLLMGPEACGKTTIGHDLVKKKNIKWVDYCKFLEDNALEDQSDDTKAGNFIQHLAKQRSTCLILENFPENLNQAIYFIRNGTTPSHVFNLHCSKDTCQERMTTIGDNNPGYVPSSILSKKIRKFNEESAGLLPFFKENTNLIEVNSDQPLDKTLEVVYSHLEPLIIHIKPSVKHQDLRNQMINDLINVHGFINLDAIKIAKGEENRGTALGQLYKQCLTENKPTVNVQVEMLKKSIYCGQPGINKFILSNFPDTIDQVKVFENNCSQINAIIYPTDNESLVEMKGNASHFSIDSYFQKKLKVKTMKEWSYKAFEEKLNGKIQFGFMVGKSLVGKTTIAKYLQDKLGYQIIDMKAQSDKIKESLGTEDAPFEGEVPIDKIEEAILDQIKCSKANAKFIFDDYTHQTEEQFLAFIDKIGVPDFILFLTAKEDKIKQRYMKKNELEEVNEDQQAELKADSDKNKSKRQNIQKKATEYGEKCLQIVQSTDKEIESVKSELKNKFSPGIIVVKHEQKLVVDNTCANLSLKYNMLYISAYQLIRNEIENHTECGQKLQASKLSKEVSKDLKVSDEFQEQMYSPVHYDKVLVYGLINKYISEKRTNQKYVILEGLLNSQLLCSEDDKIQIREMDEFFALQHYVGNVNGIISLQTQEEPIVVDPATIVYHEFPKPEVVENVEVKKPAEGEEEAPEEEPPAEENPEEGDGKKKWNPEDYTWTVSNRQSKNLAQLFVGSKGNKGVHDVKKASDYNKNRLDSIAMSIDQFIEKVSAETEDKSHYLQVIF